MSDQDHDTNSDQQSGGWSRRNVLKAGVGVGVGVAAWSGPTITSLGGTPVYAVGCTFAIDRRISGDDRNTDQGNSCVSQGGFGYHELPVFSNMPAGFSMSPNGWNSKVCSTVATPFLLTLTYPSSLKCEIQVEMYRSNGELIYVFTDISGTPTDNGNGTSSVVWRLPHQQDIQDARADLRDGPDDILGNGDDRAEPNQTFFPSDTRYAIFLRCISPGVPEECFDEVPGHNF
jgi:hypothetical protein